MNANDLTVCVVYQSQAVAKLKWFTFRQNNSGGNFIVDNDVDAYVIVQAHNADEANQLAQRIGIYFNGVDDGIDCECCGDRWDKAWVTEGTEGTEGTDEPMVYGEPVTWSPDAVLTVKAPGRRFGLADGVKVYPYNIISNR